MCRLFVVNSVRFVCLICLIYSLLLVGYFIGRIIWVLGLNCWWMVFSVLIWWLVLLFEFFIRMVIGFVRGLLMLILVNVGFMWVGK